MKAAVCRRYGPPSVVTVQELPDPVPGPGEVLIEVEAAGLTSGDARIRAARAPAGMGPMIRLAFGLWGPRREVLGREYAGRVVGLGAGVDRFQVGDAVFGITDGMRLGAHAEQVVVKSDGLILPRPKSLSEAEAAAFFFGGLTAADFLWDQCALKPGERLLVVGATGAVGSAAVQIGRAAGAHVTALASAANLKLALQLGAHEAKEYRLGPGSDLFDVVLDVPGPLPVATERLASGGRLGLVTANLIQMVGATLNPKRSSGRRVCAGVIKENRRAMDRLIGLHASGKYRPLLGEIFRLSDIQDAHAAAESGHKRGNLVLKMDPFA
jgi:NADPH:quinone reductase-like Zn-dependent oxidoreductase